MKTTSPFTFGIIAPASPCDPAVFQRGIEFLHSQGFRTKVASNPTAAWNGGGPLFSSASAQERVEGLYQLFEDREVGAILSVRGGYGAMELLPLLDLARLSKNPKPFVGISDITVLLHPLAQQTEIPAIHGAVFPNGFAKAAENQQSMESCKALFSFVAQQGERLWPDTTVLCGATQSEGRALGGNLSMLAAVQGTPWQPMYDDHILFIEDIAEKPYRLHRLLLQLKLAGALSKLRGVVVGELVNCDPQAGSDVSASDVLKDIFSEYGYPVVAGAPFGHGVYNLPFRIGEKVRIEDSQIVLLGH